MKIMTLYVDLQKARNIVKSMKDVLAAFFVKKKRIVKNPAKTTLQFAIELFAKKKDR